MRRRIPLPLLVVLAAVAVLGAAWTFAVPALQGADESAHFAYVQKIVEAHEIPWPSEFELQAEYGASVSTEQRVAWLYAGLEPLRGNLAARPLWTGADERVWAARDAGLGEKERRDGAGTPSGKNPPLYYLAAAVPYTLAGGSFFDRLFAVRLANIGLLLVTVWLTWLLAGELFGPRRALQTLAAAIVGLHPVLLDVTTRVTPDALLNTLGALALYLMAVIVRRGPSRSRLAGLVVTLLAAGFTQGRGAAFVVPAVLAVGLAVWRRSASDAQPRRLPWPGVAALIAALLVGFGLYADRWSVSGLGGFASYLWQFYLPALPGMSPPTGTNWGAEQVYLDRFWATFVQFEVTLPGDLQSALRVALWAGLALLGVAAWRHRHRLGDHKDTAIVLVCAVIFEVLALHAAAFRSLLTNHADPVITGRYLLPLVSLLGVGVAAALTALPGRSRTLAGGALLGGAFLLQLSAFGLVVARFYA